MNPFYMAFSFIIAVSLMVNAAEKISLFPYETKTEESPLLQEAFPSRTIIERTLIKREGYELVNYTIRIFKDPTKIHELSMLDVHLVVADDEDKIISANRIAHSFPTTQPPDNREFLTFSFTVRGSVEGSTTINIGRNMGIRTYYTSYRLPLKSVELQ